MDNHDLEKRMDLLEQRINILVDRINSLDAATSSDGLDPLHHGSPHQARSWHDLGLSEPVVELAENKSEDEMDKSIKSGNWLGIIAIICFVFAAGFIIKLSVETGWLTPERQVILAALFGVSLIAAGLILAKTYSAYASLLPAAGVIILYLSAFAGHRFYELTSYSLALLMTCMVSGVCIGLYWKFRHDIYAIVAVIGAYLAPIVLDLHVASFFTVYYFLCCSLTFAVISIGTRSRVMTILAAYLAILCSFFVGIDLEENLMLSVALALHFLIFAIGTYFYSVCNQQQLTEYESWTFFPVLMLFYALEYYLINLIHPNLAAWLSIAFAGLLIGLYHLAKHWLSNQKTNSQNMIYAFASIVFFHSFYLELLPPDFKPWLFVVLMVALAFLPNRCLEEKKAVFYTPVLVFALLLVIEYCNIIFQLIQGYSVSSLLVAGAAFISIWLAMGMHRDKVDEQEEYGFVLLGSAHLLAMVGLYRLADTTGSLAVTSCWLLYAMIIMGYAYSKKDKFMAHSALLVLGFAAGKALLYDASMTPTAVRILCLVLTGVVLYGAGFLMKKIAQWDKH